MVTPFLALMGYYPWAEDTLCELPEDPCLLDVLIAKKRTKQLDKDHLLLVEIVCKVANLQRKYANY
jgi:hypothetical protein